MRTPPQPNPQAQAGPSSKPDQNPDAEPADSNKSLFRKDPRRAPIKRQRSTSHPPTQLPPKGDHSCMRPPMQKPPPPAQLPPPAQPPPPEPDHHEEAPPTTDREAQPQRTTRSGRSVLRPSLLTYQVNFAQQETRDPSPKFRLPGPVAPKPPKPYHGPTTDV